MDVSILRKVLATDVSSVKSHTRKIVIPAESLDIFRQITHGSMRAGQTDDPVTGSRKPFA